MESFFVGDEPSATAPPTHHPRRPAQACFSTRSAPVSFLPPRPRSPSPRSHTPTRHSPPSSSSGPSHRTATNPATGHRSSVTSPLPHRGTDLPESSMRGRMGSRRTTKMRMKTMAESRTTPVPTTSPWLQTTTQVQVQ